MMIKNWRKEFISRQVSRNSCDLGVTLGSLPFSSEGRDGGNPQRSSLTAKNDIIAGRLLRPDKARRVHSNSRITSFHGGLQMLRFHGWCISKGAARMELRGVRWHINHAYGEAALRPSGRKRKPTRGAL